MTKLEQPPLRQRRKNDMSRAFPQKKLEQYLESCGHTYIDFRPLDMRPLAYTNGNTYTFDKGKYFTCRKENDVELTIFNSNFKKMGSSKNNTVLLKIKTAMPTRPATNPKTSGWIERRAQSDSRRGYATFNTIKIRAAIDAADDGIEVHENCGVVPVFTHAAPSSQVSHYAIEMKAMRDNLIAANKMRIESLSGWFDIEYPKYWTADQRKVLKKYEIQITDGAIRNKITGRIIRTKQQLVRLTGTIDGKEISVSILRYRAYMFSCMRHMKRDHQTEIDHIDGDHTNNDVWNLRWVSRTENCLAKHIEMSERVDSTTETLYDDHGIPEDPKEWEGWTFYSNKWIERPDGNEFIARANPDRRIYYPVIGTTVEDNGETKFRSIKCHHIVAYLHRIPPSPLASAHLETLGKSRAHFYTYESTVFEYIAELKRCGLFIMHDDDDKENYNSNNLRIGTRSENQYARHENPSTTLRKRVNIIDPMDGKLVETFESYSKAAEWFGITNSAISNAVRRNMTREIGTYKTTKNKRTGAKYAVVAAV
jgi:hypothetical protein